MTNRLKPVETKCPLFLLHEKYTKEMLIRIQRILYEVIDVNVFNTKVNLIR